ncbi:hypothetical protein EJB05_52711, partial [Eragrostis curvula]
MRAICGPRLDCGRVNVVGDRTAAHRGSARLHRTAASAWALGSFAESTVERARKKEKKRESTIQIGIRPAILLAAPAIHGIHDLLPWPRSKTALSDSRSATATASASASRSYVVGEGWCFRLLVTGRQKEKTYMQVLCNCSQMIFVSCSKYKM